MKISITNWGPIEKCEYDLQKSLIVTYGDNNIGKSYAMQVIYLVLKNLNIFAQNRIYHVEKDLYYAGLEDIHTEIRELVMDFVMNENVLEIDITDNLRSILEKYLMRLLLPQLNNSFENTFGLYENLLENDPTISLFMDNGNVIYFLIKNQQLKIKFSPKPVLLKKTDSDFHKSRDTKNCHEIFVFENYVGEPVKLIFERQNLMILEFLQDIKNSFDEVYFLPASRSGIYTGMNSFGPIFAQLAQNRALIKGTLQIPSISEPISDYYMMLSSIRYETKGTFSDVVTDIEHQILNGEVHFDHDKKIITYKGNDMDQFMEMKDVSSMVSEIAPITAYLKYIINNDCEISSSDLGNANGKKSASIIFIEEPEAHLHPSKQILLMKLFAKLSKQNVKIMMTSHSNYVFNALNNCILAGELNEESYSPVLMKSSGGKSHTFYMSMDELGADDENFADVSEMLYEEREQYISALLEKSGE